MTTFPDLKKFPQDHTVEDIAKLIGYTLRLQKATRRLITATHTIADTGCFNAADDAINQAENLLPPV